MQLLLIDIYNIGPQYVCKVSLQAFLLPMVNVLNWKTEEFCAPCALSLPHTAQTQQHSFDIKHTPPSQQVSPLSRFQFRTESSHFHPQGFLYCAPTQSCYRGCRIDRESLNPQERWEGTRWFIKSRSVDSSALTRLYLREGLAYPSAHACMILHVGINAHMQAQHC